MASSSSISNSYTPQWNHDVYLSFREEDTRKNFVDHLYTALHKRGINTYICKETLPLGVSMGMAEYKAITESRIAIVVFSENYGRSSWCLDDLPLIIKCMEDKGQTVIPIFYHVKPSDVRKQRGSFSIERSKLYKLDSWKEALTTVTIIAGYVVGYHDFPESKRIKQDVIFDTESKCIKQVVDVISNTLYLKEPLSETRTGFQDRKLKDVDYDVFLSFQGEETRFNFVDYLYSALDQNEIFTYMDKENNLFDQLNPSLIKIIKASRISVVIFSKNYASSSSCMDELLYIWDCSIRMDRIVIPIYYHVDPLDVRRQSGSFGESLSKHESLDHHKVESWRRVLSDVSNLSGLEIKNIADGYEAKGIQLIVKKISQILFPDEGLVGLHTRLGDMKHGGGDIAPPSHENLKHLRIPLHEINLATNNFFERNIIAGGGFGKVYRGLSKQHGTIAVKRLDRSRRLQGDHEFMMEIELLSACKHENIVSLVGYCSQDDEKILVLNFEKNGSLDKHLRNKNLTWIQRLQICLDAANGLKYLHEDVGAQYIIVHRDVKSSNILLDENWKGKISDFGLSKIAIANVPCSVIYSAACGTLGYIDPQYHDHNHLTQKSDVYSFGVVMFEVLCSRLANVQNYPNECKFSAQFAQNHYEKETLDEIIDSGLRSQMNSDCLRTFSTIAYQCLKTPIERPTMSLVVNQLEKALDYQQGSSGYWHDVYISFRHRDTECHIVDDICAALHQGGVSTYKDEVTLSRKESVLVKAIERSRLFVIIFTKKFAVNTWYLDEVAKIIDCMKEKRQFLLPVFLNVSRSDVRTQKGYFGEVMSEYDRHPRMEVWRNALVEATNAPGLEYSNFRTIADLITAAVKEIQNGLSIEGKGKQHLDTHGVDASHMMDEGD